MNDIMNMLGALLGGGVNGGMPNAQPPQVDPRLAAMQQMMGGGMGGGMNGSPQPMPMAAPPQSKKMMPPEMETEDPVRAQTESEVDAVARDMGEDPSDWDGYEFEGDEVPTKNDIAYMNEAGGDAAYDAFVERFGEQALRHIHGSQDKGVPLPRERPKYGSQPEYSSTEYPYPPREVYERKR